MATKETVRNHFSLRKCSDSDCREFCVDLLVETPVLMTPTPFDTFF